MTTGILGVLTALGLVAVFGLPAAFLPGFRKADFGARLGLAFLTGALALTAHAVLLSAIGIGWTVWTIGLPLLAAAALGCFVADRGDEVDYPERTAFSRKAVIAVVICLAGLIAAIWLMMSSRHTSVDLLFFWGVKGAVFADAGGIDTELLGSRFFKHAHLTYPPMLPALYAWITLISHDLPWRWLPPASFVWVLAAAPVIRHLLRWNMTSNAAALTSAAWTAAIASSLIFSSSGGNAEAPLVAYLAVACAATIGLRPSPCSPKMTALLIGLAGACLTKNEGRIAAVLLISGILARDAIVRRKLDLRPWISMIGVALAATASWIAFLAAHGLPLSDPVRESAGRITFDHVDRILAALAPNLGAGTAGLIWLIVGHRVVVGFGYYFSLSYWGGAWIPIEGFRATSPMTRSMVSHDDGTGEALYVADEDEYGVIWRWDGSEWSEVVDSTGRDLNQYIGNWIVGPFIESLASADLGDGPALYIGGLRCWHFDGSRCIDSAFVARWDGEWEVIANRTDGLVAGSTVSTMAEFDDGSGPVLFAGGRNLADESTVLGAAARWNGASWTNFDQIEGNGIGGSRWSNVSSMASFDEGSGKALFAAGSFTTAGDTAAVRIARWKDGEWSAVIDANGNGACAALGCETPVKLTLLDDSHGTSLYAVARVWQSWSQTSIDVARWTGTEWSRLGVSNSGYHTVYDITVFDDGTGPAIFGCGLFTNPGEETLMRFDGTLWKKIPGSGGYPPAGEAKTLEGWSRGIGKGLYIAGDFTEMGGLAINGFIRWDGERWSVPEGPAGVRVASGSSIRDMIVFDDGAGESLFVSADLTGDGAWSGVVKWDGERWWRLDDSAGKLPGIVAAFATFDDGGGRKLYAATNEGLRPEGIKSTISRWDGDRWTAIAENTTADESQVIETIFSHDEGDGESLFVGGRFTDFAGLPSNRIAQLDCTRYDFGDAPEPPFATLLGEDGARHVVKGGLHLGDGVSHEPDGKPSAHADRDDFDDGVAFTGSMIPGFASQVEVRSSAAALLDAWIDFNADGDWDDPGERVFDRQGISAGSNPLFFEVPLASAIGSMAVARFRLSSTGVDTPTGEAPDGEVEDYEIEISVNPTRRSGGRRAH